MRFVCAIVALAVAVSVYAAEPVTVESLLKEMVDLDRLTRLPQHEFLLKQSSSYDRASTTPEDHGAWFANADAGQYIRTEERDGKTEYVMMDADGPGAIIRIWSANPRGELCFYFDGADTPSWTVSTPDLLGGKVPGLPEPISTVCSAGWNLYFPIPYAKHCKVTLSPGDEGAGMYYVINHRQYASGVDVQTFTPELIRAVQPETERVAKILSAPYKHAPEGQAWKVVGASTTPLKPNASATYEIVSDKASGGAGFVIRELRVKIDADELDRALRETLLTLEFDGQETVSAPLGDFFGTAPGVNVYESLPLGMNDDNTLWSRWVMPGQKTATMRLTNLGAQDVRVLACDAVWDKQPWTDKSLYFHANWRASYNYPTRPMTDWNYCDLKGQGVFVGASCHIGNPVPTWWGEGDEKIYVDGETFPSFFGTGTEDYYGYAWCHTAPFQHAYHNQPRCDGPGNYGDTSVNRWHIIDCIPFNTSLKFDMEIWHWVDTVVNVDVATYWYARPGAKHAFEPLTAENVIYSPIPAYKPLQVMGAIEGETIRVIEHSAGHVSKQHIERTSGGEHLWWNGELRTGDHLTVALPAPEAGLYRIVGRFVTADDYGVIQVSVNDQKIERKLDLYCNHIQVTEEIDLGQYTLKAGENRFEITIVGVNPAAKELNCVGLDYLRIMPIAVEK